MGNSASKASRSAGQAAKRQYPTRVPPASHTQQAPATQAAPSQAGSPSGPTVHPKSQASFEKTQEIASDAFDPQLAASLRSIGPVTPNPTQSNSSTFAPPTTSRTSAPIFPSADANPALQVVRARSELSKRAEHEFETLGRKGAPGREFLDVMQIRQILMMRDQRKLGPEEIEIKLGLKPGVLERLGKSGVVGEVGDRYTTAQEGGALG